LHPMKALKQNSRNYKTHGVLVNTCGASVICA
jgi:hypothetical protein